MIGVYIVHRGCSLEQDVVIGQGTQVGREGAAVATISKSVIGRNCTIGSVNDALGFLKGALQAPLNV